MSVESVSKLEESPFCADATMGEILLDADEGAFRLTLRYNTGDFKVDLLAGQASLSEFSFPNRAPDLLSFWRKFGVFDLTHTVDAVSFGPYEDIVTNLRRCRVVGTQFVEGREGNVLVYTLKAESVETPSLDKLIEQATEKWQVKPS